MRVLVPPNTFKDPTTAQWARDVSDIGRGLDTWTPAVREFPGYTTSANSITVHSSAYALIGSLCLVSLDVEFHVAASVSPATSIAISLPFPPPALPPRAATQKGIVYAYNLDNTGAGAQNVAEIYFNSLVYAVVTVRSTAGNTSWYRDPAVTTKSRITGNFFYMINNRIQGAGA